MFKKFYSILVGAVLTSGLSAFADTTEFTYAQGELFAYGQGRKENIDVAMRMANSSLVGMKITGIKAYVTTPDGIENTSIWLSNDLTLVDKINVPDIASYDVTPVASPYGNDVLGLLSIELPEPYIITEAPVYIGYSMTVSETDSQLQQYPIVLSEGINPDGLFLHMSKSVLKWMDYNQKAEGVAYIVVTLEGDFSEYSVAIHDTEVGYVTEDEDFNLEFSMSNNGEHQVSSLKYSYSYDDSSTVYEGSMTLPSPVAPDITITWPVTLSFQGIEGMGPHLLKVSIDEVDGNPNGSSHASVETVVNVMPYRPVNRPLVEEYTGLWCGWCPRGFVGMEELSKKFGDDNVIICYHNKDAMTVTSVYPVDFGGYPNASLNRDVILDPYYGTYNEDVDFGIAFDVENAMARLTMADIEVEAALDGQTVDIKSATTFMIDIDKANYQVGYVLVSDGLYNQDWYQTNYYAGLGSEYVGTYLEEMCDMPKRVYGLVFNDVAVEVSAMMGVENSLPSSVKTGVAYSHEYSISFEGNELVQDPDNLVVCAFVIDKSTGFIVNANKYKIGNAGVTSIEAENEIVSTSYFDLSGRKISHPSQGLFIKTDSMKDGSVKTSKIFLR